MKNTTHYLLLVLFAFFQACSSSVTSNDDKTADFSSLGLQDDVFNYFVIGDWGRNGDFNQKEVAQQMNALALKSDPAFIISTGDNFYSNGVASTSDPLWKSSFEDVYDGGALLVNWFAVLGNHDYHGNPQAQIDYSKVSRRWNMPARYYTFATHEEGVDVRFIFLDTNPLVKKYYKEKEDYADIAEQDSTAQLRWLDSVLTNSKEPWKIVVGHHPVYSSSLKHGDTEELISLLVPRFEKHHVQAYFCGHDHDLQHSKGNGQTDYFLSGAGSECRETGKNERTRFSIARSGYALVRMTPDDMTLNYIDYEGNVVYSYTRKK